MKSPTAQIPKNRVAVRFDSIQAMRGVAAIAVVYYHIFVIAGRFLDLPYRGPLAEMGNLGVDFFFVLSGFIITWVHFFDFGKRSEVLRYAAKRAVRIYPLLWIIISFKLASVMAFPAISPASKDYAKTVTASFLLIPSASGYIIDVQWTLVYEATFYVLFGIALLCGKRGAVVLASLWLTSIAIAIATRTELGPASPLQILLSARNVQFLAGALTAVVLRQRVLTLGQSGVVGALGTAATALGLAAGLRSPIFWAAPFSCLVAAGASLDVMRFWRIPRIAVLLGDASYSIYLTHTSVQMVVIVMGKKLGFPFGFFGQVLLHFTGAASVLVALLCYRQIEKPILAYFHRRLVRKTGAS